MRHLKAMIVLFSLAGFGLMACTPEYSGEEPAAASSMAADENPASSAWEKVDLGAPLTLIGTEPFWAVKIADGAAVLSRMDQVEASYSVEGFNISGATATLQSGNLTLTLNAQTCSDGMSDRRYPLTAEVNVGEETLKGCAINTAGLKANPA